ncbi:HAD family hydrolase [Phycisphaera mikurensis]|nr:hypothetical protein [Phycisphaera mikurensis]MBB6443102.1 hypothetical protein [Phycisphaera mikurensis]
MQPRFRSTSRFDAVLCDVDGCLVDEAGGPLPLEKLGRIAAHNRLALDAEDRPIVTLCTGRPEPFAECLARVIGNPLLPIVCENGAWLHDPTDNAYLLDPAVTAEDLAAVAALEGWVRRELGSAGVSIQPGKTASVSLYHPDAELLEAFKPRLRDAADGHGWPFRVSGTWSYINCDLRKVSKATGIARLLALTGIEAARCAGIGDTAHDLQIAESVAWFGVPHNRDPILDDAADRIAAAPGVDGVIELLAHLGPPVP